MVAKAVIRMGRRRVAPASSRAARVCSPAQRGCGEPGARVRFAPGWKVSLRIAKPGANSESRPRQAGQGLLVQPP